MDIIMWLTYDKATIVHMRIRRHTEISSVHQMQSRIWLAFHSTAAARV